MKIIILYFVILLALTSKAQVKVSGYTKNNGTYVAPYTRSSPNSSPYDNYSYPGNTNPYTGKTATGDPDTYIDNLYNNNNASSPSRIWVEGYYKENGTYVSGYWRTSPNGTTNDNYSSTNSLKTSDEKLNNYLNSYNGNIYESKYFVSSKLLNLRSGPSTEYSILTSLKYGDIVEFLNTANSNWSKVKVLYYDGYSLKTSIGYVYSDYISSSNANYLDSDYEINNYSYNEELEKLLTQSYNSTKSYSESLPDYDLSDLSHPYGNNFGKITLWTDCSSDGEISIYIDGIYKGKLTSFFYTNSTIDCDNSGTLSIILSKGIYKVKAVGNSKAWEDYVTISADECLLKQLSK